MFVTHALSPIGVETTTEPAKQGIVESIISHDILREQTKQYMHTIATHDSVQFSGEATATVKSDQQLAERVSPKNVRRHERATLVQHNGESHD